MVEEHDERSACAQCKHDKSLIALKMISTCLVLMLANLSWGAYMFNVVEHYTSSWVVWYSILSFAWISAYTVVGYNMSGVTLTEIHKKLHEAHNSIIQLESTIKYLESK